jgi:hypothetical protein
VEEEEEEGVTGNYTGNLKRRREEEGKLPVTLPVTGGAGPRGSEGSKERENASQGFRFKV